MHQFAARKTRSGWSRIDADQIHSEHSIVDVVSQYGIELRRSGTHFTARCPFHGDAGRPNLVVFPGSGRWVCFRCDARGDVFDFVQQIERLTFREAAARLCSVPNQRRDVRFTATRRPRREAAGRQAELDAGERAALKAAVELYGNRLMVDGDALAYMAGRGFERSVLEQERIGYAQGGELVPYLLWRGLPLRDAKRVGLLHSDGQEAMQGRIVIPECRDGQPIWAIGRSLRDDVEPRYLGLPGPGRRALLGWDAARRDRRGVCIVEGPMDRLALRKWGVPALALCGTGINTAMLKELENWERLYIVMDADSAGRDASTRLIEAFGDRAVPVLLPEEVKDPAELARRSNGDRLFAASIREASDRRRR